MSKCDAESKFERWTVIKRIDRDNLLCRCVCGTKRVVRTSNLYSGASSSCGCLRSEVTTRRSTKHGQAIQGNQSREYKAWCAMIQRVENPKSEHFLDYGGRGIGISKDWRSDFRNFLNDMGKCPAGFTLERKNVNREYSRKNCVWSDWKTQHNNKRRSVRGIIDGKTLTAKEISKSFNIPLMTVYGRLNRGDIKCVRLNLMRAA